MSENDLLAPETMEPKAKKPRKPRKQAEQPALPPLSDALAALQPPAKTGLAGVVAEHYEEIKACLDRHVRWEAIAEALKPYGFEVKDKTLAAIYSHERMKRGEEPKRAPTRRKKKEEESSGE